jgi:hypothetical protein
MILLKKRPHLFLEIPLAMMRLLFVDVAEQSARIRGTDRKCTVSALPCERPDTLRLHPFGRAYLDLLRQFRQGPGRMQTHGKMNMVGHSSHAEAFAVFVANDGSEICVQRRPHILAHQRPAIFGAEDEMNQDKAQCLRHSADYKSGLPPSGLTRALSWGVAPGWYKAAPLALVLACTLLSGGGCKSSAPPAPVTQATAQTDAATYPPRPSVAPPAFKVFHQDNDTYTLVTKADASDDEISALMWQFRDATRSHGFDALHLSQKFIDARKPTVWFHVYRGAKCANEKFTKGKLPCKAAYHGAGDYTLGDYKNTAWNMGVLRHADGSETQLWNADAPDAAAAPKS